MKTYRTKFIDYDTRLQDMNDKRYAKKGIERRFACVACGAETNGKYALHVVDGGAFALHPEDESKYAPDAGDCGLHYIGLDCLKNSGLEEYNLI